MSMGAALFALTAIQAVSSIAKGYAQKDEANYNATLVEGKAQMIDAQSEIEYGQYNRIKGQVMSRSIANIGGAGIMPQGSAMAVMLDAQTQINIDQAIGQFNYKQEKNYTIAQANQIRRQGSAAVREGYTNAFTSLLTGGANYALYKGMGNQTTSVGTIKDTTFDSVSTYAFNNNSYKKVSGAINKRSPAGFLEANKYSKYEKILY